MQYFEVTPEETKTAKWPHEIFLINLVFNHILVFASTFGVFSTFPLMVLIVPLTSFAIIGYIYFKARQVATGSDSFFVKAHWHVADKRNKHFMYLLIGTCVMVGGGLLLAQTFGWSKIVIIALVGGVGLLPFMVSLLVLIVLGNDSVDQAKKGRLPKKLVIALQEAS